MVRVNIATFPEVVSLPTNQVYKLAENVTVVLALPRPTIFRAMLPGESKV